MAQSWKNLGLIHILVVSGGHLSILAALLVHIARAQVLLPSASEARARRTKILVGIVLIFFSLANRLQPPVLRSLLEWFFRSKLERRGWRSPEIALVTTWLALPFSSTIFDLLSLALSFFASVTVEGAARKLHRHPLLSLISIQISVWWILMPLLFTMGLPHPLTTMTNILLAPLLGATLIPFAMLTWLSGAAPAISGLQDDPIYMGYLFDLAWSKIAIGIRWLADALPAATPKVSGVQPLVLGFEITTVLVMAVFCATCALLVRSQRESRRRGVARSSLAPAMTVAAATAASIVLHHALAMK
jgi:hypothetical protein